MFVCHIVSLNTCSDAAKSGVVAWDCKYNEEVMLIPYGLFVAGDNPMQAEECSHAGLNCNYFCRTCDVGGTKQHKESAAGYESIFVVGILLWCLQSNDTCLQAGNLRTPEGTAQEIRRQFETAFKSGAATKLQNSVSTTGIRDSASSSILNTLVELGKKLRKRTAGSQALSETAIEATLQKEFEDLMKGKGLDDVINPLFGMEGSFFFVDSDVTLSCWQAWIFIWTRPPRFFIRYFLVLLNTSGGKPSFSSKKPSSSMFFSIGSSPSTRMD